MVVRVCNRTLITLVASLGCVWPVRSIGHEAAPLNWTSPDAPCANYDDVRKSALGNIGVRIDTGEAWREAFRRAFIFWNMVLDVNFHEQTDLDACSIRIIDGAPTLFSNAAVARSQITERAGFQGKIAVNQGAAGQPSSDEIYAIAVHELGHMLGLRHNASAHSVMYFLNLDGTAVLEAHDISELGRLHRLRPDILALGSLPLDVAAPECRRLAKDIGIRRKSPTHNVTYASELMSHPFRIN